MTALVALRRERLAWATVLAAALLVLAAAAYVGRGSRQPQPVVTPSLISIAPADQLASNESESESEGRPSRTAMALSPNGRTVVFSALSGNRPQLFRRDLDQPKAVSMAGTEGAVSPFFSPDGKWVGFWDRKALSKVALDGGPITKVCDVTSFSGASWGRNETIVYGSNSGGLWLVPSGGGTKTSLTTLDKKTGEYGHWLPQFLPDGKTVLFTVVNHPLPDWKEARLWIVASSGERRELGLGEGADARYASSGHLVFVRSGTLVAAPFDLTKGEVTGKPLTVLAGVMQAAYTPISWIETGAGQFSLSSESGALVYVQGGVFPDTDQPVVSVDWGGTAKVLPGLPRRRYLSPRLSPDQSQLVVWSQGVDRIVWTYDIRRGTLTRRTTTGRNSWAIWGPDGKLTFSRSSGGGESLFLMPADGSGEPEPLIPTEAGTVRQPSSWYGRTLAFMEANPGRNQPYTVMTWSLDGNRLPAPFLPTGSIASSTPEFSPDGRYLAYSYFTSGRWQVYVRPYPGPGREQKISKEDGFAPAWSLDQHELFYVVRMGPDRIRMMAVPIVTMKPSLTFGQPRELFTGRYKMPPNIRNYEVTKDGQRFYLTRLPEDPPVQVRQMILVQNWFEELRWKVPPGR